MPYCEFAIPQFGIFQKNSMSVNKCTKWDRDLCLTSWMISLRNISNETCNRMNFFTKTSKTTHHGSEKISFLGTKIWGLLPQDKKVRKCELL